MALTATTAPAALLQIESSTDLVWACLSALTMRANDDLSLRQWPDYNDALTALSKTYTELVKTDEFNRQYKEWQAERAAKGEH